MLDWPVREGLLAYRAWLRRELRAQWEFAITVYALVAPWQGADGRVPPPDVPDLLRDA